MNKFVYAIYILFPLSINFSLGQNEISNELDKQESSLLECERYMNVTEDIFQQMNLTDIQKANLTEDVACTIYCAVLKLIPDQIDELTGGFILDKFNFTSDGELDSFLNAKSDLTNMTIRECFLIQGDSKCKTTALQSDCLLTHILPKIFETFLKLMVEFFISD